MQLVYASHAHTAAAAAQGAGTPRRAKASLPASVCSSAERNALSARLALSVAPLPEKQHEQQQPSCQTTSMGSARRPSSALELVSCKQSAISAQSLASSSHVPASALTQHASSSDVPAVALTQHDANAAAGVSTLWSSRHVGDWPTAAIPFVVVITPLPITCPTLLTLLPREEPRPPHTPRAREARTQCTSHRRSRAAPPCTPPPLLPKLQHQR